MEIPYTKNLYTKIPFTKIPFTKMTGSGNDFIVVDNFDKRLSILDIMQSIPKICARGISEGADGFFMLEPVDGADFTWHFYNADGSRADMCGNAARCAARFAYVKGYVGKRMAFMTGAGLVSAEIMDGVNVKIQMTQPHSMKIDCQSKLTDKYGVYSYINTGVPHVVLFVEDIDNVDVATDGRTVRYHKEFEPKGSNVNFVKKDGINTLRLRTYERGVEAETLACGTGSVAVALIAIQKGLVSSPVTIRTSGGVDLTVYAEGDKVYLEGEARMLSEGVLFEESMNY